MNRATPICDRAEIIRALGVILEPGQVTELRAIDVTDSSYRTPHVVSGYFDDPEQLAKAVAGISDAQGIYIVPNVANPALLARAANRARAVGKKPTTSDGDILRRRWLLVDCDPTRPAGISSTDAEHEAAIGVAMSIAESLATAGWPAPVIGDSGNGAHVLYRIDLPADDDGLCQRCLEALDHIYNTDAVKVDLTTFNPARIWKLYGTMSGKGDSTPDRPHRLATLLDVPEKLEAAPIDLLKQLAARAPSQAAPPKTANGHRFNSEDEDPQTWLEWWIKDHNVPVSAGETYSDGLRYRFEQCPFNSDHGRNDAAIIIRKATGKLGFHCFHDGCKGRDWAQLREVYDPESQRQSHRDNGRSHAQANSNGHNGDGNGRTKKKHLREAVLLTLSDVEAKLIDWLWQNKIALGKVTLLAGDPGTGKSTVAMDIAAHVTTGTPFCDGTPCPDGSVLLMSLEDDDGDTTRRRADSACADASRIKLVKGVRVPCEGEDRIRSFTLTDVDVLKNALIDNPDTRLIVIDPVSACLGGEDSHNNSDVRGLLAPLAQLAADYHVALLLITHLNKGGGGRAMYRAMGSLAFVAAARAAFIAVKDRQNPRRRLLLPIKNNLGDDESGNAYTIIDDNGIGRVVWEHDAVTDTADDLLIDKPDDEKSQGRRPAERTAAEDWLCEELGDMQEHPVPSLREAAASAGLAWRTVQRAADELAVIRHRASFGSGYTWRLPRPGSAVARAGRYTNSGTQGGTQGESPDSTSTYDVPDTLAHKGVNVARKESGTQATDQTKPDPVEVRL